MHRHPDWSILATEEDGETIRSSIPSWFRCAAGTPGVGVQLQGYVSRCGFGCCPGRPRADGRCRPGGGCSWRGRLRNRRSRGRRERFGGSWSRRQIGWSRLGWGWRQRVWGDWNRRRGVRNRRNRRRRPRFGGNWSRRGRLGWSRLGRGWLGRGWRQQGWNGRLGWSRLGRGWRQRGRNGRRGWHRRRNFFLRSWRALVRDGSGVLQPSLLGRRKRRRWSAPGSRKILLRLLSAGVRQPTELCLPQSAPRNQQLWFLFGVPRRSVLAVVLPRGYPLLSACARPSRG
jgi:hypothetical protein